MTLQKPWLTFPVCSREGSREVPESLRVFSYTTKASFGWGGGGTRILEAT